MITILNVSPIMLRVLYCFIATTLDTVVDPRVYRLMILIRYVVKGQGQTVGHTLDKLYWLG